MPISPPPPFGLLGPLSIVAGHGNGNFDKSPVHIMVPIDSERAVLVSIDERGNYMVSDPYARIPGITGGQVMATTIYGKGPLVFVDLTDGWYYGHNYPFSDARFRSIEQIVKAVCAGLSRPCPSFLHGYA
jgi:hypothetical protein